MDFYSVIPLLDPPFINESIEDKQLNEKWKVKGFESMFNCP